MARLLESSNLLRRHPLALPLGAFFLILLFIGSLAGPGRGPQIGILPIEGVIMESETLLAKIKLLEEEDRVKAVLVRVNSPGGGAASSQEIYGALKRLSAKKPVYTSVASVAASGGYYVALGTHKIYANPASLTGSIGVILQSLNAAEAFGKLGLKMETIKAGKNKDIGNMFRPMTEAEKGLLSAVLADVHDQFMAAIVANRPLKREQVEVLADGRIFTGRQAADAGLIDGLMGFEQVISALEKKAGVKGAELYYPPEPTKEIFQRLGLEEASKILSQARGLALLDPNLGFLKL